MQPVGAVLWACVAGEVLRAFQAVAAAEGSSGIEETELWRHVSIESSWFKTTVTLMPRNLSLIPCGAACMRQDWCRLWCHEALHDCLLTSIAASASYTPTQPFGALSCYTSRPSDLAVGAVITSSPPNYPDKRQKENLVDGIYGGGLNDCAKVISMNGINAWFLLDLGAAVPVSEVVLVAQPNSNAYYHLRDVEVRVGDVQMTGDFTTYQLLGTFPGPAEVEQTIVLRPTSTITGRYVSIQRTTADYLQIAHLEIH